MIIKQRTIQHNATRLGSLEILRHALCALSFTEAFYRKHSFTCAWEEKKCRGKKHSDGNPVHTYLARSEVCLNTIGCASQDKDIGAGCLVQNLSLDLLSNAYKEILIA